MKVKDILSVYVGEIKLFSGKNGKLLAKSKNKIEELKDVDVLGVYSKIETSKDESGARTYLFVFISHSQVDEIRKGNR